jgi:hypothetical protein
MIAPRWTVPLGRYEGRLVRFALLVVVQWSNSVRPGDKSRPSALRLQRLSVPTQLAVALPQMGWRRSRPALRPRDRRRAGISASEPN